MFNSEPWMSNPARRCNPNNGQHPDAWFPHPTQARRAKALCGGCPVAQQCLTYALADPQLEGIWAGTTEADRARIRNRNVA